MCNLIQCAQIGKSDLSKDVASIFTKNGFGTSPHDTKVSQKKLPEPPMPLTHSQLSFISEIKEKIRLAQYEALKAVNIHLIQLYSQWGLIPSTHLRTIFRAAGIGKTNEPPRSRAPRYPWRCLILTEARSIGNL
jgi:hypothetical protein